MSTSGEKVACICGASSETDGPNRGTAYDSDANGCVGCHASRCAGDFGSGMAKPEADEHTITTRTAPCPGSIRGNGGSTAADTAWHPTTIDNTTKANTLLGHPGLQLIILIFHHLIISVGAIMIPGRFPASISELQEQQLLVL